MSVATLEKPQQMYELQIQGPAARIWEAITRPEFTGRYFYGSLVDSTLEAGSPILYHAPDRSVVLVEGTVLEAVPGERLVHSWKSHYNPNGLGDAPTRVTWMIRPAGEDECTLTLVHDGFEGETATFHDVAAGWPLVLDGLKAVVEGREVQPLS